MDSLEHYLDQQPGMANPMTLKVGDVVGDWRIRALIGCGGSSEVYRVEHVRNGSFAALKLLLPAKSAEADERCFRRFRQEVELLSAGGYPGFPRFRASGTWQGRPYLVEELLEPRDLPRTDRDTAKYLLAICRGVSELHKSGVVHRDLKPGNILFRSNGEPVIVDLGLAKRPVPTGVESDASLENGKPIGVGTPGYAAPEQFMGGEISPAADIHALGVLLEKIIAQKEWRSGFLSASHWRRIIRRATSSIPSERYPSVESFAAAIRRRHWPVYSAALVLILGVIAVGGLMMVGGGLTPHGYQEFLITRGIRPPRNPDKTQSALNVDFETLEENTLLNGETKVFSRPIHLASNRTYRITGPGTLDADISGSTNSLLVLTNCVLINRTTQLYPKNGVRYQLDNGVYLNFINQKERLWRSRRFLLPYDGGYNKVRFGGPATLKELYRLQDEESMERIRREYEAW